MLRRRLVKRIMNAAPDYLLDQRGKMMLDWFFEVMGVAEVVCPCCNGSGTVDGDYCPACVGFQEIPEGLANYLRVMSRQPGYSSIVEGERWTPLMKKLVVV